MLGEFLDAVGLPAAAVRVGDCSRPVIEAVNRPLAALLGDDSRNLRGAPATRLLPASVVEEWARNKVTAPVDTRLGADAAIYRAIPRELVAEGRRLVIVTFLAMPASPALAGTLGAADLGMTALEVLEMQAEMVSRWRPDGTILYCNEAFARQCGRLIDEVIGANLFDLTPAHEIDQIRRNVAKLSASATTSGYDHLIVLPDGGERWQEWIDRLLLDEDGAVIGYLSVGRDITSRKLAERQLAESERRLKLALETGRQGVWELNFATRRITIDDALEGLLGLPAGIYDLDMDGALATYHPDDRALVHGALAAVVAGETEVYRVEARRLRADGSFFWVSNYGRVTDRDDRGRPAQMVGTTIDVDRRKRFELGLSDREQRLRLALEAGNLGVWEYDLGTDRIHLDGMCLTRLGHDLEHAYWSLGEVLELIHPRDRAKLRAMFGRFRRGRRSQAQIEFRARRRDGRYLWIEEHAQVSARAPDGRPTQIVGVSADITARKEAELQLAHLALHDPLTGLPNRRALSEAIERSIARAQRSGQPLAVLALDLDGFKAINDRLGHPAGDATLLEVADRLRRAIRRSDVVARLGGDEFAVIATEAGGRGPMARLARRISAALVAPITLAEGEARIGVSVGIAFYPADGETTDQLLARADEALYDAKRRAAGCTFAAELRAVAA